MQHVLDQPPVRQRAPLQLQLHIEDARKAERLLSANLDRIRLAQQNPANFRRLQELQFEFDSCLFCHARVIAALDYMLKKLDAERDAERDK